jgi:hypothetical protein
MRLAEFPLVSVATTWVPAIVAGTAQALKLPVASVVQDEETLLPSKVKVILSFRAKPVPLTAALLPTASILVMAGLTVKVALVVPAVVPSDAVTVWSPAVAAGTANAQLLLAGRLPLASVVQMPDVLSWVPSSVTVRVLPALKLLPHSLTVLPTVPATVLPTVHAIEFRLMTGLTVYIAEAEFALVSVAVTV